MWTLEEGQWSGGLAQEGHCSADFLLQGQFGHGLVNPPALLVLFLPLMKGLLLLDLNLFLDMKFRNYLYYIQYVTELHPYDLVARLWPEICD